MKGNFKKIPAAVGKMLMLICIALLLSQCSSRELEERYISSRADALANSLKGSHDGYIRVLRTLANIMADYENIPTRERRDRYDDLLAVVLQSEPEIAALYTVWKPNALDGRDSMHIGDPGSSPSGQYAVSFNNDYGQLYKNTVKNADIDIVMGYFYGPDSKKDHVENPVLGKQNGKDTYLIRMSVPIVNLRTDETTGIVGCLLSIDAIQIFVEQSLMNYVEIAAMTVYSNNGFIMGSFVPDRIGKNMIDVDAIYGNYLQEAKRAVAEGMIFYCLSYSPVLLTNVTIFLTPFSIGYSDTTWSIMIATTEEYFKYLKRRSFLFFR